MATDQYVVDSQHGAPQRVPPPPPRGGGWGRVLLSLLILAGVAGGAYFFLFAPDPDHSRASPAQERPAAHGGSEASDGPDLPRVEVTRPRRGGMERTTNQPGTVHAFDFAELFAKVSGYVKELKVDRGSRVKKGDLLLELDVPELLAAVEQARAALVRAQAAVEQAKARVEVATQKIKASAAYRDEMEAKYKASTAQRQYRSKQYARIKELVERGSVERRLEDEELDRYETAQADEIAARAGVDTAVARIAEANADLIQAKADVAGAQADVKVSQANLDKEQALESYTHIHSPYDGVVIFRGEGVHVGAFVRSADQGMNQPILTVARDDLMRTVIPVPDRDAPYCDLGDPAIVRVDALSGREFKGVVSRIAEAEDVNDRTMRVEVDLPNPQRVLREGMYGRAEIILEKGTTNMTVPSTAILSRDNKGKGAVEVVRDGKMYRQPVVIGRDNGTTAEIISGLDTEADVIVQPDVSMADGTPVQVESGVAAATPRKAGEGHS